MAADFMLHYYYGRIQKLNPPLILNSVLMVSLPSVILYKHLLNSHRLVVVNPLLIFLDLPLTGNHIIQCIVTCTYRLAIAWIMVFTATIIDCNYVHYFLVCCFRWQSSTDLWCGLFYEILNFVTAETKSFPPSCQFLSSCVDVLGQEFIERDPDQAVTLLQLLLHQRMLGGLLAPLFHPNGCPAKFLEMYASVGQVAKKEGPSVAFSVLSKVQM